MDHDLKMLRMTLLVGVLMLAARLGVLAREMAMAHQFGRGDEAEAFVIAYLVPAFVVSVCGTAFGAAFIPTYIKVRDGQGPAAAQHLLGSASGWSLLVLTLIVVALAALAPLYLPCLVSNFDAAKLDLTQRLLWLLAPFALLGAMAAIWSSVLNAEERFALPAVVTILEPLAAVVLLVLAADTLGIFGLAAGTVIGAGIQALAVGLAVNRAGVSLRPRLAAPDSQSAQVLVQYAPMLAAAVVISFTTLIDHAMAAALEPGSVAALSYGRKVVDALAGLGAIALGTVLFPRFSQMVARGDWHGCRRVLGVYSGFVVLGLVPLTAIVVALSTPLVALLFERGRFAPADTGLVADVQTLYALQLPFYIGAVVGIRMIWALRRNAFFLYANIASLVLKVGLNLLLMRWLGIAGIALATSLMYLVSCGAIFLYARAALARAVRS